MPLIVIGQVFQGDNSPQSRSGHKAESDVLNSLQDIFSKQNGRIFVNQKILGSPKVPDFVIPVFSQTSEGELSFILIECKSEKYTYLDGSTRYSDPYNQIQEYRDAIKNCFMRFNKKIEIECFAIFPNNENFSTHVKNGRDGIRWGNLEYLKEQLHDRKLVPIDHALYEVDVNYIYNERTVLRSKRIEILEREAKKKVKPFGDIYGYKGVAGTGKTYLLAEQIHQDALEMKRELLYITHNKNLVNEFIKLIEKKSNKKSIEKPYFLSGPENKPIVQICYDNGSVIYFTNFDAFPTKVFTRGLDKLLYRKNSYGPLYEICKNHKIGGSDDEAKHPSPEGYINCRKDLIAKLKENEFAIRCNFQLFDGIYVDELQDCKQDPNRLRIPLLFTAHNHEGRPNVFFSEDTLQTYLSWERCIELNKVQQEEDEGSVELKKRKDGEITYKDLFELEKPLHSSHFVTIYDVYRTPENIFKASFSLLEDGFKKGKYEELLAKLKFRLKDGSIFKIMESEELKAKIEDESKRSSPGEVMVISHFSDKRRVTATHHQFECRGCEASSVYIYVHDDFLKNPNFLYTLMCRTKDSLTLIKMEQNDDENFDVLFRKLLPRV